MGDLKANICNPDFSQKKHVGMCMAYGVHKIGAKCSTQAFV